MSELLSDPEQVRHQSRGRRMLILLLAMFALPILAVAAMYQFDWHPGGQSHGQLVSPAQALQLSDLQTGQGKKFGAANWQDKWTLVYIIQGNCDTACEKQLHDLRQIHAALNKEIDRAQRVLLSTTDTPALAAIQLQYPDLVILSGPAVQQLAIQFNAGRPAGEVYLVDPLGNLMMRYAPNFESRGMFKDLMRLLTYSSVG